MTKNQKGYEENETNSRDIVQCTSRERPGSNPSQQTWKATFVLDGDFEHELQHPYLQCLGRFSPLASVVRRSEYQVGRNSGGNGVVLLTTISRWI